MIFHMPIGVLTFFFFFLILVIVKTIKETKGGLNQNASLITFLFLFHRMRSFFVFNEFAFLLCSSSTLRSCSTNTILLLYSRALLSSLLHPCASLSLVLQSTLLKSLARSKPLSMVCKEHSHFILACVLTTTGSVIETIFHYFQKLTNNISHPKVRP